MKWGQGKLLSKVTKTLGDTANTLKRDCCQTPSLGGCYQDRKSMGRECVLMALTQNPQHSEQAHKHANVRVHDAEGQHRNALHLDVVDEVVAALGKRSTY